MHVAHRVRETRGLCGDGSCHRGVGVPAERHAERGGEIEIAVAVDIGDGRAATGRPDDRKVACDIRDPARFTARERADEFTRTRPGNLGAETFEIAHCDRVMARTNGRIRPSPPCSPASDGD